MCIRDRCTTIVIQPILTHLCRLAMINARDPQQLREAKHLYLHTSKTLTEFPVCMQMRQNVQHQQFLTGSYWGTSIMHTVDCCLFMCWHRCEHALWGIACPNQKTKDMVVMSASVRKFGSMPALDKGMMSYRGKFKTKLCTPILKLMINDNSKFP